REIARGPQRLGQSGDGTDVEGGVVEAAPALGGSGEFEPVVGPGQGSEADPGLTGEVVHGGGGVVDVPLCFGLGQCPLGGGGDVVEGGGSGVGESGGRGQRVRRCPDHASAGGGRPAQLRGL